MPLLAKRIAMSAGFGVLWVAVGYVVWGVSVRFRYDAAFEATKVGDSMSAVVERFGRPTDVESHREGTDGFHCISSCRFRLWYEKPLLGGIEPMAIDFGDQLVVVDKYHYSSP
jgi:hypothetical protein